MPSLASLILIFFLMVVSFFAGVNYCSDIKDQSSWMFETEEELDLPSSRQNFQDIDSSQ